MNGREKSLCDVNIKSALRYRQGLFDVHADYADITRALLCRCTTLLNRNQIVAEITGNFKMVFKIGENFASDSSV